MTSYMANERSAATGFAPVAGRLEGVRKHYGRNGAPDVLHGVSAVFPHGTMTAVMGLSGSGKSTLLHLASGLDQPNAGRIWLGGVEITKMSRRRLATLRRRKVGFVFQDLNLVPTLTVAENIALPLRLDGRPVSSSHVARAAHQVGIADFLGRLPGQLSGGQQQRVAIARALITRPDIVFADEPTAALDPYTAETVLGLLRRAVDETGQAVVVVTHDPDVAAYADSAIILDHGHVAEVRAVPEAADLRQILRKLGADSRRGVSR
jgi:putative ABC transport system ATP-binding protein